MSQPPPSPPSGGQPMPNGRPRPGGRPGPQQRYVDYGNPRAFDTSMRPASGLTAARYAPAPLQPPQQQQPASAWSTQTRRVQEVSQEAGTFPWRTVVLWGLVGVLSLCLIVVLGYFFLQFVFTTTGSFLWWPVLALLAFLSLLVICGLMLLADRWDPQPVPLLIIPVLWGAAIAVAASYVLNTINQILVFVFTGDEMLAGIAGAVVSAPLVEETTKGLGLILLLLLARRYFNGPLDGLIYGALIGGGFAFTENILYYSRELDGPLGFGGVIFLFVMRGVLNIFGHAIYVSTAGVIMGFVTRKWGTLPGVLSFVVAVIPGMLLHAGWNLLATFSYVSIWITILMFGSQIVISLIWLALIAVLMWDESRFTRVRLGDYANLGWLTHEEVDMLATWKGRREGRRWAGGFGQKPLMKRFIRESADLASVRQRLLADGGSPKAIAQERKLLDRLRINRAELLNAAA